jgi:hypothetical protein
MTIIRALPALAALRTFLVLAAAAAVFARPALAARFEIHSYESQLFSLDSPQPTTTTEHNMSINGDIAPGDEVKFLELLPMVTHGVNFIALHSHGGNVRAALRIAQAIHDAGDQVIVEVTAYEECYSACFFILAAAHIRAIDPTARIGVHQSSIYGLPELDGTLALAKRMRVWRVSPDITDAMLATPPGGLYILSKAQMQDMDTAPFMCFWATTKHC